jgi:hypothetical protein
VIPGGGADQRRIPYLTRLDRGSTLRSSSRDAVPFTWRYPVRRKASTHIGGSRPTRELHVRSAHASVGPRLGERTLRGHGGSAIQRRPYGLSPRPLESRSQAKGGRNALTHQVWNDVSTEISAHRPDADTTGATSSIRLLRGRSQRRQDSRSLRGCGAVLQVLGPLRPFRVDRLDNAPSQARDQYGAQTVFVME